MPHQIRFRSPGRRAWGLGSVLAALLWGALGTGAGQGAEPRSGDEFRRQLLAPAAVTWTQNPLREALGSLERQWQLAILLDRRVDPDQRVDFVSPRGASLDELFQALAKQLELGVAYVESVVYLGPAATAEVLATVAEERYDAAQQQRVTFLSRRAPLAWPALSEPRGLLAMQLPQPEACPNLNELPYDLWPAAEWPALPLTHRLSLLLAGFDRSFEWDEESRTLRLIPLPPTASLVRDYSLKGEPRQKLAELQREFPEARLEQVGNRVRVTGSAEAHYWIRRAAQDLPSLAPRRDAKSDVRYALRATARFEGLAKAIAQRLELTLEIDPQLDAQRATEVSLDVKDATQAELLQALAETIQAAYELRGDTLLVRPK